jgi:hypothetical protein
MRHESGPGDEEETNRNTSDNVRETKGINRDTTLFFVYLEKNRLCSPGSSDTISGSTENIVPQF